MIGQCDKLFATNKENMKHFKDKTGTFLIDPIMYSVTTSEVKAIDLPTTPKRLVRHLLMYFDESYYDTWDIFSNDALENDATVQKLVDIKNMIQNLKSAYSPKGYSFLIIKSSSTCPGMACAALKNDVVIIQAEMEGFTKFSDVSDDKTRIDMLATRINNVIKLYGQKQIRPTAEVAPNQAIIMSEL